MEQILVDHVTRGELLDLGPGEVIDEVAMNGWGQSRTIPAKVIRDILRGELAPSPDPRGLRLRGARITGHLSLEKLTSSVAFELYECLLSEGITADDAQLPALVLDGCFILRSGDSPLSAKRLATSAISLKRSTIIGEAESGLVVLSGAKIGGPLNCDGTRIENESGPALKADSLTVDHGVELRRMRARGRSQDPAVSLGAAQIKGSLNCAGATVRNSAGPALHADGIQINRNVVLRGGFVAHGSGSGGAVNFAAARIGGEISCIGAKLRNNSGPALNAAAIQVDGHVVLLGDFEAYGSGNAGTVSLRAAKVGGVLNCGGARLHNDNGPALNADGAEFKSSVWLRDGFEAYGNGQLGAVRMATASIGGQLSCDTAKFRNNSGPAISAESIQVGQQVLFRKLEARGDGTEGAVVLAAARIGGMLNCNGGRFYSRKGPALSAESIHVSHHALFRSGFEARGSARRGAVRLAASRIGGVLNFEGAKLRNDDGPALHAEIAQFDQHILLHEGFEASGSGDQGAVRLGAARIGGAVILKGAKLSNESGPALQAAGLQVGQRVVMDGGFEAQGGGSGATLDMRDMKISGRLVFAPTRLEHSNLTPLLSVEQLQYSGLPGEDWKRWLTLLRVATAAYTAQPYQQLASAHRALGHDREARMVLIAQRRDQLRRAVSSSSERVWGRITGTTLGYGYQPWRALIALLVIVVTAVLLSALGPGAHGGLSHLTKGGTDASCSVVERIGVGLDFGLPLIKTGARSRCDVTGTAAGQALAITGWLLQALAWGFATLFVAGFTGAVRKT